jgi:hypothetical protein
VSVSAPPADDAAIRIRKERIHTTMLIEVLALLVFMAMAFAFVVKEEERANPWREKAEKLERELAAARVENAELHRRIASLEAQNQALEDSLRRLVGKRDGTVPANDQVFIAKAVLDKLTDRLANAEAMVGELQRDNAGLRQKLAGPKAGGIDRPVCTVTAGYLVSMDLLGDGGYRVRGAWNRGANVSQIPGLGGLDAGQVMTPAQFRTFAARIAEWGRSQPQPCVFRANALASHGNLRLYLRQLGVAEQYFYVHKN